MKRSLFLASTVLAVGTASAGPLHPIHNSDGTVDVNGHVYATTYDYLTSQEFRDAGGRCGVDRPIHPALALVQTDCDGDSTTISSMYAPDQTFVIQVVFHIVTNTSGAGTVDDAHVQSQIDIMNEDYQAIANSHGADGTNAKVKFVLARFDPQGNPTTGIDRVTNNSYFTEGHSGSSPMKTALHWDTTRYLNIYSNDLDSQGLLGYATFPFESAGQPVDGVVLAYQSVGLNPAYAPYDLGASATHEVGHYLGLYHTFQGPQASNDGCAGSSDPYQQGDLLADTPKEGSANYDCAPIASGCVSGEMSPIENYMDYSKDSCMTKFTSEQADRIRCSIITYRYPNTEPRADFTFTTTALDADVHEHQHRHAESQASELHYNWDFGDGMTSTDQNPMHTYAADGSYDVTLEVVDPGSAANTSKQTVVVAATGGNGSGSGNGNGGGGDAGLGGGARVAMARAAVAVARRQRAACRSCCAEFPSPSCCCAAVVASYFGRRATRMSPPPK